MSDRVQIEARVRELLAQVLDVSPSQIGPEFSETSYAAWTSLNHLMLISQLEGEFGVAFSNQDIRNLTSFTAIVETIARRLDATV